MAKQELDTQYAECAECATRGVLKMFNDYTTVRDQLDAVNADYMELQDKYDNYVAGIRDILHDLPINADEAESLAREVNALRKSVKEYQDAQVAHLGGLPVDLILYDTGPGPVRSWSCGSDGFEHHAKRIAQKLGVTEVVYYKAVGRIRNKPGGDEVGEYEELGE